MRAHQTLLDPATHDAPLNPAFERLAETIVLTLTELDPVEASWRGVRSPIDQTFPEPTAEGLEEEQRRIKDLLRELGQFGTEDLAPDQQIDSAMVQGRLTTQLSLLDLRPIWRVMPQAAVDQVAAGIAVHVMRACTTVEERAVALLSRLRRVPGFLDRARSEARR